MRIGQTSFVVFASKLASSVLGFAATIYFANVLGAEVLGIYAAVLALVAWLNLGSSMGVGLAMKKRISEGEEQDRYFTAGVLTITAALVVIVLVLVATQGYVEAYIDSFDRYVGTSVVWFVIGLLVVEVGLTVVLNTLHGKNLVHVAGILEPVRIGGRSTAQIALVFFGVGLLGLIVGHAIGVAITGLIGMAVVSIRLRRPARRHFRRLVEYAKYSWFGGLKARAFNNADILVLEALVASSLVGVYSVVWSLSTFFNAFGGAINQAVFPEVSNLSAQEGAEATTGIIEDALAYTGLIIFPGLVGGLIIGERLLRIYGPEFVQGTQVLGLLLLSILFHNYMRQLLNALNAIDRPDIPFRINVAFIAANIVLNVVLVLQIGWVGAAVASALSTGGGLVLAYVSLSRIVSFSFPALEVGRQVFAALLMGGVVWLLQTSIETRDLLSHNAALVSGLVFVGASVYFVTLLAISPDLRETLDRNFPVDLY